MEKSDNLTTYFLHERMKNRIYFGAVAKYFIQKNLLNPNFIPTFAPEKLKMIL